MKPDALSKKDQQTVLTQKCVPTYGTIQAGLGQHGAFEATPPPSDSRPVTGYGSSIQHNQRMSNLTRVHRTASDTMMHIPHHAGLIQGLNAAIHSPIFRTLSPQISPHRRNRSFTPYSTESSMSQLYEGGKNMHTFRSLSHLSYPSSVDLGADSPRKDAASHHGKVGPWGAAFSIINLFLGLGLLSFPYVKCSDSMSPVGLLTVNDCVVCYITKMLNVSELAFNAFLGCVCKVLTVGVIVITFFADTEVVERTEYDYVPQSLPMFSVSIGIFILSFAGHACLPEIYVSMKDPTQFEQVMDICFVIMFFTYSGFALFGYLQYGPETNVIITENLVTATSGKGQLIVGKTLIGFVIASCYFQVSPILSVVSAIPEDLCGIQTPMKKRIFRTLLFGAIAVCSWFIMSHLAVLEAVTGSLCTMITSVICPALFYYGLNRKTVSRGETLLLFVYFISGIGIGCFLLYNDIDGIISGQE